MPDSEDEGNYEDSDAYEESFIDDQSYPVVGSGQTEDSKLDMMAIYRFFFLNLSSLHMRNKLSNTCIFIQDKFYQLEFGRPLVEAHIYTMVGYRFEDVLSYSSNTLE